MIPMQALHSVHSSLSKAAAMRYAMPRGCTESYNKQEHIRKNASSSKREEFGMWLCAEGAAPKSQRLIRVHCVGKKQISTLRILRQPLRSAELTFDFFRTAKTTTD
ncbi:hypothetical protein GBF38_005381 [Nibea albiflora]|uniref:Uncharacterized protein n=1 Tax=Nibea albiflora TaxID=240163 RepID=A0ACB7EW02_NIBAL|nr:hypothetical protein GBF38_005381 [Nibea albiflora]